MSSTRNKNCPGDYKLEQNINTHIGEYPTYVGSSVAVQNYFPGNGLLAAKNPRQALCTNYLDVESALFGIGSTNLVNPKAAVTPDFNPVQSLNVIDRLPVLVPEPLLVEKGHRPLYLN
jgi:hypothetical protein